MPRDSHETHADIIKRLTITTAGNSADPDRVFQLYALFGGDPVRTGHAAGLSDKKVSRLSAEGQWDLRLGAILKLQKSGKPGDMERGINRAVNFIQAHQYRQFLDRLMMLMVRMDAETLKDYCLTTIVVRRKARDGSETETVEKRVTTRPFADLAAALEKCHAMTYQALSDTSTDRKTRGDLPDTDMSVAELHALMSDSIAKELKNVSEALPLPETEKTL